MLQTKLLSRLAAAASGCVALSAASSSSSSSSCNISSSDASPPIDETARLRRQSTRAAGQDYAAGQKFLILRVPQLVAKTVDVGHISVLIQNHDGSHASLGFYAKSYRRGMAGTLVTRDEGILVSPDPLYVKAARDPSLKALITPLYQGELTAEQAARLNAWTDDEESKVLELTKFTTSAGEARERAVARLDGESYAGAAALISGTENCATFTEKLFPGTIDCKFGLPRLCRVRESASKS